ncbi:MAG: hypothetical protein WDN00_01925 [Limisphaerales bacterium]
MNQSGNAISTTISNLPPGQYRVKFSDVTFYQTPAGQTNTVSANGTVNFTGNYVFIDANHNGISDSWENYYFGSAGNDRTQTTDSDGDGMPDYAEFIAGTNPTNAASKLIFVSAAVQTNRFVQLKWAAIPGRLYQLESSTNLNTWTPLTSLQQATYQPDVPIRERMQLRAHNFSGCRWDRESRFALDRINRIFRLNSSELNLVNSVNPVLAQRFNTSARCGQSHPTKP